jgi:hypothetical protein
VIRRASLWLRFVSDHVSGVAVWLLLESLGESPARLLIALSIVLVLRSRAGMLHEVYHILTCHRLTDICFTTESRLAI